jgi:hypothetical protein
VEAARQGNGRPASERPRDENSRMPDDGRPWKARDVRVRDARDVLEAIGEAREPGTKDDADGRRLRTNAVLDGTRSLASRRRAVPGGY